MNAMIWQTMSLFEQLSNIEGEVTRLIDDHERFVNGDIQNDHSMDYIKNILKLIELTFDDPKNREKKIAEKELNDEVTEIIRYLNGDYEAQYIKDYWKQYTDAIS
ncbi:MAG: hypothetical protein K6G12_07605 [Lachnospiraceae bacterium]|nr:hypothetical protein [Lachnospiraceae bacterium]